MLSAGKKKTSKGRRKVELKKIENEDALYISFSKRRNGVFVKASELSTLCGAEVLILIYSPAGKPHTFGSPDVNLLADRFFSGGVVQPIGSLSEQAYRKGRMRGLNGQMMELGRSVETLKGRKNAILEHTMAITQGLDLDEHEEGMTYEKLEELKKKLEIFKDHVEAQVNFLTGGTYPSMHTDHNGGSSPSYAHAMHTLDPYNQPSHGLSQQWKPTSLLNPFESVSESSDPLDLVMSLNPTGTAPNLLDPQSSVPFQVDWSDRNRPTDANTLESEFYHPKPSSSTNSFETGPELNNLFK